MVDILTICNGVCVPKKRRKRLRETVRRVSRFGSKEKDRRHLLGQVAYFGRLHRREAERLRGTLWECADVVPSSGPSMAGCSGVE